MQIAATGLVKLKIVVVILIYIIAINEALTLSILT